jgi:hypothetical protein
VARAVAVVRVDRSHGGGRALAELHDVPHALTLRA